MNSDLVFSASKNVANRYLLCRIAARTVRTLHFASANTQDAITDAFVRIGNPPEIPPLYELQASSAACLQSVPPTT